MAKRVSWITSRGIMTEEEMRQEGGEISVILPCWICRKTANFLIAIQSPAKPDDNISSILEGHIRRLT